MLKEIRKKYKKTEESNLPGTKKECKWARGIRRNERKENMLEGNNAKNKKDDKQRKRNWETMKNGNMKKEWKSKKISTYFLKDKGKINFKKDWISEFDGSENEVLMNRNIKKEENEQNINIF